MRKYQQAMFTKFSPSTVILVTVMVCPPRPQNRPVSPQSPQTIEPSALMNDNDPSSSARVAARTHSPAFPVPLALCTIPNLGQF